MKKIAVIFLNYKRYETAAITLAYNLPIAGYPFGLIVVEEHGIAKAINTGLKKAKDYDAYCVMGNDILEPDNWLKKRVDFLNETPKCGIVSVPYNIEKPAPSKEMIIGNYLIRKEVVESIGGFDEKFDPYGANDCDYCERANRAGFETWYLGGCKAIHGGEHGDQESSNRYGYNKLEMINKTWHIHVNRVNGIDDTLKIEL